MYVDDCVYGTRAMVRSDIRDPINLGSEEMVTINQLVDLVEDLAGIQVERRYNLDAPRGVRGRSSDNTVLRQRLGWEPETSFAEMLDEMVQADLAQLSASAA